MNPVIWLSTLATVVVLLGCDAPYATTTLPTTAISYADPKEQLHFKSALQAANIPFEIEVLDGSEYIKWEVKDQQKISAIQSNLFGPPLPLGRHVSLDPTHQEEFKQWLAQNGIQYSTQINRGREYIAWSESDSARVHKSPFAPGTPSPNPSINTDATR